MENYEKGNRSYVDFRVSYIHLKDVTITQNLLDPDKMTNRLIEM